MTTETKQDTAVMDEMTLCFQLHVKMPGVKRRADKDKIDLGGADEDMMGVSKLIVDSAEFRAIGRHVRYMKAYLRTKGLPSPVLRGGTYQIPLERVDLVVSKVDEMKDEFFGLVDEFVAALPRLTNEAEERLGPQFDINDYPSAQRMRASFDVITNFIETRVPGKLRKISHTLFESERQKNQHMWTSLEGTIGQLMMGEMKNLIDKMVTMTGYREDGKKMGFQTATANKLSEFLQEAPYRNVLNNKDLDKVVQQASKLLSGLDPTVVKDDLEYRDTLHESFELLQTRLEGMLTEQAREITFDDEA